MVVVPRGLLGVLPECLGLLAAAETPLPLCGRPPLLPTLTLPSRASGCGHGSLRSLGPAVFPRCFRVNALDLTPSLPFFFYSHQMCLNCFTLLLFCVWGRWFDSAGGEPADAASVGVIV